MPKHQRFKYEMFVRVRDYGITHTELFPESSTGGQTFAKVTATVAAIDEHLKNRVLATAEARKVKAATRAAGDATGNGHEPVPDASTPVPQGRDLDRAGLRRGSRKAAGSVPLPGSAGHVHQRLPGAGGRTSTGSGRPTQQQDNETAGAGGDSDQPGRRPGGHPRSGCHRGDCDSAGSRRVRHLSARRIEGQRTSSSGAVKPPAAGVDTTTPAAPDAMPEPLVLDPVLALEKAS